MIITLVACIPDTTSPGTDGKRPSRAETETVPGRTSRESHPSEDLSELPLSGQEYQRWCCHRKTDRPRSAFWTVGPAPHLQCRIHADTCTGGSSRSLQCRCPFSIFTRHTNGCISVSGYSLCKEQSRHFPVSPKAPSLLIQFRKPVRNKTSKTSHNVQ